MGLPTTENFIAAAELELGFVLPDWLRSRLLRENGGNIEAAGECWELFSVFDTTDRRHITRSTINIVRETSSARSWTGFPQSAVAIARNGGGDYLVLLPDNVSPAISYAAAYRWQHDTDDQPVLVAVSCDSSAV